jgi:hypothetical protein
MSYVIIHKNRVIVGPMDWSQKYFSNVLKIRHKILANVPGTAPETFPYIIDENTEIRKVIENRPELNPMINYYYGPLWDLSDEIVIANYEVKEVAIETARDNLRSILAAERYKKEVAGTKILLGSSEVTLDTSREGRNIFIQKFLLMTDIETVNWKFPEGWFVLTKSDLGAVVQVGANHIQSAFDWEKETNSKIDSCQTLEDIINLSFTD